MPITALPIPPSRSDPANFATRADAFLGALPTFATEANAQAAIVDAQALSATNAAITATAQANAASALVNATKWVSGTNYTTDTPVWSPLDQATYRRKSPGGISTIDPSLDSTGWAKATPDGLPQFLLLQQGII